MKSELSAAESRGAERRRHICYDITDLLVFAQRNNEVTGIQRVAISTLQRIVKKYGAHSVDLVAFVKKKEEFIRTDAAIFVDFIRYEQMEFCHHFGIANPRASSGDRTLTAYLNDKYRGTLAFGWHWMRLHLRNFFSHGRDFERRGIIKKNEAISSHMPPAQWQPAEFTREDRLFIPGASWEFPRYNEVVGRLKREIGFSVYQYVHDLIPLVVPEYLGPGLPGRFEEWFRGVLDIADVILVNSEATGSDIRRFGDLTDTRVPDVRTVPLAHEFELPPPLPDARRHIRMFNDRKWRLADHATFRVLNEAHEPYALVVGTIESRKNIYRLLMVWHHLWLQHGPAIPLLVLAGKLGVFIDGIDGFLQATGHVGGRVRVIERPTDGEVAFLYANCMFSVCISYYEGWGLPIGESLWFGRPVLASTSSSLPEVGGNLVVYADPTDSVDIEAKLSRLIFDAPYREALAATISTANLRTWDDVTANIWDELAR